jgi:hypothetical protein
MASSELVKAKIASLGMSLLQPAAGLAVLERLLATPALTGASLTGPQLTMPAQGVVDVVPFRWARMLQRYQPLPVLFQAVAEDAAVAASRQAKGVVAGKAVGRPAQQQTAAASSAADADQLLSAIRAAVLDVLGREVGHTILT